MGRMKLLVFLGEPWKLWREVGFLKERKNNQHALQLAITPSQCIARQNSGGKERSETFGTPPFFF
jgi:hypothetical protein